MRNLLGPKLLYGIDLPNEDEERESLSDLFPKSDDNEKLVIYYDHDDFECYCEYHIPIEYSSKDDLRNDLIQAAEAAIERKKLDFNFRNENFEAYNIIREDFKIYSLEEWFEEKKI